MAVRYRESDFRIDILEIAEEFNLPRIKQRGNEIVFRCPFCGDSRKRRNHGHLYINARKNVFRCHRCGEEGNALQLYAYLRGIDTKEAYRELAGKDEDSGFRKISLKNTQFGSASLPSQRKVIEIYATLMEILPLYERHLKALEKRGFTAEYAKKNFRSLPDTVSERNKIINELVKRHISLRNIPGFYSRNGRWEMVSGPGILIPVKNLEGKIVGFQVRRDNPGVVTVTGEGTVKILVSVWDDETEDEEKAVVEIIAKKDAKPRTVVTKQDNIQVIHPAEAPPGATFKIRVIYKTEDVTGDAEYSITGPAVLNTNRSGKYTWFSSSGLEKGTGVTAVPTVLIKNPSCNRVWVTEGILKSETASFVTGANFIGVPGITIWQNAVEIITEKIKPSLAIIAFDQEENPHTREQERLIVENLNAKGIPAIRVGWKKEEGKGIDDFILKTKKFSERDLLDFFGINEKTDPAEKAATKNLLIKMSQFFMEIAKKI